MKVDNNIIEINMKKTISIKLYEEILSLFDQPCFFSFEFEMQSQYPALLYYFFLVVGSTTIRHLCFVQSVLRSLVQKYSQCNGWLAEQQRFPNQAQTWASQGESQG